MQSAIKIELVRKQNRKVVIVIILAVQSIKIKWIVINKWQEIKTPAETHIYIYIKKCMHCEDNLLKIINSNKKTDW